MTEIKQGRKPKVENKVEDRPVDVDMSGHFEEVKTVEEETGVFDQQADENTTDTILDTNSTTEETVEEPTLEDKEIAHIEEPKKLKAKPRDMKETKHRFDPGDPVFVADFRNIRDNAGYTKIENQFRFAPLQGEIERVIITRESGVKVVQYKLKNKAGSLYDEEDVCATLDEAETICKEKNR